MGLENKNHILAEKEKEEKNENTRDRLVPDGSHNKHSPIITRLREFETEDVLTSKGTEESDK